MKRVIALLLAIVLFMSSVSAQTLTVTNSYANCRSAPGAGNTYLGRVYRGQTYDIIDSGCAPNGKLWYQTPKGWVCSSFVRVDDVPTPKTPQTASGRRRYLGSYYITGYCRACNSPKGSLATASGKAAQVGRTVAMKGLPFGTKIYIDGIGVRIVEDRGVGKGCVDVFCANCADERKITGHRDVWILEE